MNEEGRKKRSAGGKDVQRNFTLKVDDELMEKTHRYGINLSRFHEYALVNALKKVFENHTETFRIDRRHLIEVLRGALKLRYLELRKNIVELS